MIPLLALLLDQSSAPALKAEDIQSLLALVDVKPTATELKSGYNVNGYRFARLMGKRIVTLTYYAKTQILSMRDETSGLGRATAERSLDAAVLQQSAQNYLSKFGRQFFPSSAVANSMQFQSPISTARGEITFVWHSIRNGYSGLNDGDLVRVSLKRDTGKLIGIEMKRGRTYEPPRILVDKDKALKVARTRMNFRETGQHLVKGKLYYHLFNDATSRSLFARNQEIRLRLGYYFNCDNSSGFVDAATGAVDIINCVDGCK